MTAVNRRGEPIIHADVQRVRNEGLTALPEKALAHIFSFVKSRRNCFAAALTCRQFSVLIPKERREIFPPVPPQVAIIRSEGIGGFSCEVLDKIFSFLKSGTDLFATALTCKQFTSILPNVRFDYHSLFVKSRNRNPPFIGYFKKVPLSCMSNHYKKEDITLQEEEKPSDWKYQDDRRSFNPYQGHLATRLAQLDDNESDTHKTVFIKENERELEIGTFGLYMDCVVSNKLIEKTVDSSKTKVVQIITTQGDFYHFPVSPADSKLLSPGVLNIFRDSRNAQDDSLLTHAEKQNTNSSNPKLEGNPKKRSYDKAKFDPPTTNPTGQKKRKIITLVKDAFPIQDTDFVLLSCEINDNTIKLLWNSESLQILQKIPGSILQASPSGKLFFTGSFLPGECQLYKFNKDLNKYELLNLDFCENLFKNRNISYNDGDVDVCFLNDTYLIFQLDGKCFFLYNLQTEEVTKLPKLPKRRISVTNISSNMLIANHHIVFTVPNSTKETVLYIQNTITGIYQSFTGRILSSKRQSNIHEFRIINRDETSFVQVCLKYDHTNFGGPIYEYVEISLGSNVAIGLNKDGATLPVPMPDINSSEEEEEEQLPNNMADYANIVPLDPDSEMSPTLAGLLERW